MMWEISPSAMNCGRAICKEDLSLEIRSSRPCASLSLEIYTTVASLADCMIASTLGKKHATSLSLEIYAFALSLDVGAIVLLLEKAHVTNLSLEIRTLSTDDGAIAL